VRGAVVRVLADDFRDSGSHHETWDGRDEAGTPVASGTYFYEIRAGSAHESRRMVLLR
jgi:flagellar hook assembly protein FlgD